MDSVTQAILAGVIAGAAGGVTETAKKTIVDAYEGLKGIIKKKFSGHSDLAQAIKMVEAEPASDARRGLLGEEVKKSKLAADEDVRSAAELLLELLRWLPESQKHIQSVTGVGNAMADHGSVAISNVTGWPQK